MRNNIVHSGADQLTYEIRGIVDIARKIEKAGIPVTWENIGDPIAKSQPVPVWIKDIVKAQIDNDKTFGYSPTRGLLATREYIATERNTEGGAQITADDILFFNGLGDAISIIYTYLNQNARVIGPSPAYPTHSSAEAAHADSAHLTYNLDPHNNWLPDIVDLRNKIKYNPSIAGILIINPDNPTGMIYPEETLREIVAIAKEFDLFIVSDEIYAHIAYDPEKFTSLAQVIGDVPGIAMRGLSKEIPWPGARCGWIEVYNANHDTVFARYARTLLDAKMLEVCSTTLPQAVLPHIYQHAQYHDHLAAQRDFYQRRAVEATQALGDIPGVHVIEPRGAFYLSVVFDDDVLNNQQSLPIANAGVAGIVAGAVENVTPDKRFVYYLLGASGICVVPLSGFNTDISGFRATLLERDDAKFTQTFTELAARMKEYIASA
jgi:alanine-synthesizing transaminase